MTKKKKSKKLFPTTGQHMTGGSYSLIAVWLMILTISFNPITSSKPSCSLGQFCRTECIIITLQSKTILNIIFWATELCEQWVCEVSVGMRHTNDKGFILSPGLLGFSRSAPTLNRHCTTRMQPVNPRIWLYSLTVPINKRHTKAAFTPTKTHHVSRKSDTNTTQRTTGRLLC